jgi:hypothetical protein
MPVWEKWELKECGGCTWTGWYDNSYNTVVDMHEGKKV